jgi:hypothetical protein
MVIFKKGLSSMPSTGPVNIDRLLRSYIVLDELPTPLSNSLETWSRRIAYPIRKKAEINGDVKPEDGWVFVDGEFRRKES